MKNATYVRYSYIIKPNILQIITLRPSLQLVKDTFFAHRLGHRQQRTQQQQEQTTEYLRRTDIHSTI